MLVIRDAATAVVGEMPTHREALVTIITQPALVALLAALAEGNRPASHAPDAPIERTPGVSAEATSHQATTRSDQEPTPAWLAWEESKVRRLLATVPGLSAWDD